MCKDYWRNIQLVIKIPNINLEFLFQMFSSCSNACNVIIPGVPKKRNGGFSVHCELKVLYYFTSLDRSSSAEENDTKIIKFGWVISVLCPFLEIQSFSNFAWFSRPMSEELCPEKPSIMVFCGSPLIRVSLVATPTDQWASPNTLWKPLPATILRSSVAKIKRNLKMTVFQEVGIDSKLLNQI